MIKHNRPTTPRAVQAVFLSSLALAGCASAAKVEELGKRVTAVEYGLLENDRTLDQNLRGLAEHLDQRLMSLSGTIDGVKIKTDNIQIQESGGMCALSCGREEESIGLKSQY